MPGTLRHDQLVTVTGEAVELRAGRGGPDALVDAIAARQRRVIAYHQLREAGLTRSAIAHRIDRARLHRIRRGIFLVGHPDPLPLALETGALLACGTGAALDDATAAAIWGFRPVVPGPIHVRVVGRNPGQLPGIRIHRASVLRDHDVCVRDGLVLTTPARTLVTLAGSLSARDLRWAVEDARVRRLVTSAEVAQRLAQSRRCRGAAKLAGVLAAARDGPRLTRAESERILLDLVAAARLPTPATNVRVAGFEVDAYWRDHRLVVEIDGFAAHGTRSAFERDRHRDATLQSRGIRVARFTWRQLTEEPAATVTLLSRLLARPQDT